MRTYPRGNQYKDYDGFDEPNEPREPQVAKRRRAKTHEEEDANLAYFERVNPSIAAWWNGSGRDFGFAMSMRNAVREWGGLTDGQRLAVEKCVQKSLDFQERQQSRIAAAVKIDVSVVRERFNRGAVVFYLSVRERDFKFSLAKSYSANAGAIYVADGEVYLGKIVGTSFVRSRECTDDDEADLLLACENPLENAIAFGRRTGKCSCCGRRLENEESISLGIGPICRAKYFG